MKKLKPIEHENMTKKTKEAEGLNRYIGKRLCVRKIDTFGYIFSIKRIFMKKEKLFQRVVNNFSYKNY